MMIVSALPVILICPPGRFIAVLTLLLIPEDASRGRGMLLVIIVESYLLYMLALDLISGGRRLAWQAASSGCNRRARSN